MATFQTSAPTTRGGAVFSRRNKIGFVLALLLGLFDIPAVLMPTPDGEAGPPIAVLILSSICGLVTVAAVAYGWRRNSWAAIRIGAAARIVSMLSAMPAFFVEDVSGALQLMAAVFVLLTIVTVVLMLTPSRRSNGGDGR